MFETFLDKTIRIIQFIVSKVLTGKYFSFRDKGMLMHANNVHIDNQKFKDNKSITDFMSRHFMQG